MTQPAPQDLLSDVLSVVRLDTAFFANAELSSPWATWTPSGQEAARTLSPGAQHLIIYHYLIEGQCYAQVEGERPVRLQSGDIVMYPHGDAHTMGSGEKVEPIAAEVSFHHWLRHGLTLARLGGGGDVTKLICGFLVCDPKVSATVLAGLPKLVKVNILEEPTGRWLEESIRFAVVQAKSSQSGNQVVLNKLAEALFVETVRRHVAGLPDDAAGWIAGARDPAVGQALTLLHRDVGHCWTIADLARQVGVSRSVLAQKFSHNMGEPPMAYLKRRRLQLAAQALVATSRGVAEIGAEVGYESEAAFNRAFKRLFEAPPAQYRNRMRMASRVSPT